MQLSKRLKKATAVLTAAVVMTVGQRMASAQALKQLPEESLLVLKIANLTATSTKIAAFSQALGLQAFAPDLADPLGWAERESGFTKGVDKAGDVAFAYIDPASAGVEKEKSLVILVPVSDYAAFITNFPDAKAEGDVTQVTMKGGGTDPGFISQWGTYAAISPSKDVVSKKPAGVTPTKLAQAELDGKDFVLFANLPKLRSALQPEIGKLKEKAMEEVEKKLNEKPEAKAYIPAARVGVNQLVGVVEAFLRDADAATVSVNIGTEGLSFTVLSDFQPDSYLGKLTAGVKNTETSMLAGLPDGKYFFFGGGTASPVVAKTLTNDLIGPVVDELKKIDGPEAANVKTIVDYIDGMNTMADKTEGAAFGIIQPTGPLGVEAIIQSLTIIHGDSAALKDSYTKAMQASSEISKLASGNELTDVKTTITPAARTIDGVAFDQYKVDMIFDPAKPEAAQMKQMMTFMYGPDGTTQYVAPIDAKNTMVFMGVKDETVAGAIKAVKANENALAKIDGVKAVAGQLPASRAFEGYIPLDNIVMSAVGYAQGFGMPVKFQLPPELPPIGFTAGTEGSAIRADYYVPTQLISSLISAGLQAYAAMQGPQGGGGDGGGL